MICEVINKIVIVVMEIRQTNGRICSTRYDYNRFDTDQFVRQNFVYGCIHM